MHRVAFITFALFCFAGSIRAQLPVSAAKDTVRLSSDSEFRMTKSPLEAVLLSTVLPGAGQVYLHQAWKLPIIYGLLGAFGYGAYIQNARYHAAIDSVANRYGRMTAQDTFWAHAWESSREFYRNDRDKWWIYMGLAYVANVLDAYIAANLYDFDVSTPGGSSVPLESDYDPIDRRVTITYTLHF